MYNIANYFTFVKPPTRKFSKFLFANYDTTNYLLYFRIMNSTERKKFRYTDKWRNFRKKIIEEQKVDPVTGSKLTKMCNLHHCNLDEDHYDDISNRDNFVALNLETHKVVHFLFLKSRPKAWRQRIKGLIKILEKMEELNGKK